MSKISCSEVLAEIEQFIDGELPAEDSIYLAKHLIECSPCLDRADFQRRLKEILQRKCRASADAPPEHLLIRVRATIRSERHQIGDV